MELLQRLWIAWQPIVDLTQGTVLGHEALIRGPSKSRWAQPAQLFAWAEDVGQSDALEMTCRQLAYETARHAWRSRTQRLFLNVDGRWPRLLESWEQPRADEVPLAIEISEQRSALENRPLLSALARWREAGHLIVMDDYGVGYAGAAAALTIHPHLLKVDRQLVANIDTDDHKQAMVRAIRTWTDDLGIRLVAEGIETEAELAMLRDMGCDYGQGYLIGRPSVALLPDRNALPASLAAPPAPPSSDPTLAFYARSIAQSPIPSYVVDRRRRLVAWNPAAETLLGYAPEDMVATLCFESPLDHQDQDGRRLCTGMCPLVASMVSQQPRAMVASARSRDGRRHILRVWVTPLFDAARGRVVGVLEQFQLHAAWPSAAPSRQEAPVS